MPHLYVSLQQIIVTVWLSHRQLLQTDLIIILKWVVHEIHIRCRVSKRCLILIITGCRIIISIKTCSRQEKLDNSDNQTSCQLKEGQVKYWDWWWHRKYRIVLKHFHLVIFSSCFGTECKTFYPKWFRLPNKIIEKTLCQAELIFYGRSKSWFHRSLKFLYK